MNLDQLYPYGFRSTLFDRLLSEHREQQGLTVQALRQSVAHDLEDLLNTRVGGSSSDPSMYPYAHQSILNFGIIDFVGLSTANPLDRERICQSIQKAITAHEPRLTQIKVEMLINSDNMGALCLSIQAFLNIHPIYEPIVFDALLKPMTQQYVISVQS